MFKNNNQAVIQKLTKRSLHSGKLRNFFIVLTITMSTTLLMVMSLAYSEMRENEKRQEERAPQVTYQNVDEKQIQALNNDPRIEEIVLMKTAPGFETDDDTINLSYVDTEAKQIKTVGEQLVQGHLPEAENEVMVDQSYLKKIGKQAKIGEEISINFLDGSTETFRVSGLSDEKPLLNIYSILVSKAYAETGSQLKNRAYRAATRIIGAEKMSETEFREISNSIGEAHGIFRKDVRENPNFLNTISIRLDDLILIGIVSALILLASILVIYSVFYISVIEKIRQFGQLRTIGMTQKQVKKMITREGMILGSISIFIGIFLGWGIGYLILPEGWHFLNTLMISGAVIIIELITVLISIKKPAKLAATISPIEASQFSGNAGEVSRKNKKIKKITPFNLAKLNFSRNRKKTFATAVSLGISGVLFLVATTFLMSMDREGYSQQGKFRFGDYVIGFSTNAVQTAEHGSSDIKLTNPLNEALKKEIEQIPNVKEVSSVQQAEAKLEYNNQSDGGELTAFNREEVAILNQYLEEGSIDYDEMVKNNGILILGNNVTEEVYGWRYQLGDPVKGYYFNGEERQEVFKIAGFLNTNYQLTRPTGWFLVPEENMNRMMNGLNLNNYFIIKADYKTHGAQIEENLRAIVDRNPLLSLETLRERLVIDQESFSSFYLLILGPALFILAFSLINFVNTLITSILTRRQEFALLQSIGMTSKQLFQMVQWEGLILSLSNLLISLVLGMSISYGLILLMRNTGADYMQFQFPTWFMLGYTLIIFLIPMVIAKISMRIKQSLVERLKESN